MSATTTPAIERAARALDADQGALVPSGPTRIALADARLALAAALDVEEMARVAYAEGAWCGVCEYEGWDACADCRTTLIGYATAIRTAILGTDS